MPGSATAPCLDITVAVDPGSSVIGMCVNRTEACDGGVAPRNHLEIGQPDEDGVALDRFGARPTIGRRRLRYPQSATGRRPATFHSSLPTLGAQTHGVLTYKYAVPPDVGSTWLVPDVRTSQ